MNADLTQLLDLIGRQKAVYDGLLDLAKQKKDAIVKGDITTMDQVVASEEALLLHITELERLRREITQGVAVRCEVDVDQLTLANWPDLDDEQRDQIDRLQTDFRQTLDEISEINQVNSRLLTIHLDYVQAVINEVTQTQRSSSYDKDGSQQTRRLQRLNLVDEVM